MHTIRAKIGKPKFQYCMKSEYAYIYIFISYFWLFWGNNESNKLIINALTHLFQTDQTDQLQYGQSINLFLVKTWSKCWSVLVILLIY